MTEAEMLQLPRVRRKLIFSQLSDKDSMKQLLGLQLRHLLKYAEVIDAVRSNDKLLID